MTVRLVHTSTSLAPDSARKLNMIRILRGLLKDAFQLRKNGALYARLAHSQGYADGYMRVLVDAGYVTEHELLDIVAEVRRGVDGPATCVVAGEHGSAVGMGCS